MTYRRTLSAKQPSLSSRYTNWDDFRRLINERLTRNPERASKFFSNTIQWASSNATPKHKRTLKAYDCSILTKQEVKRKENSEQNGTDYEHPHTGEYITQQHRNSKNSEMTTNMTASKHSCKDLYQQNPLNIPAVKRPMN
jgi:hypothetical protein